MIREFHEQEIILSDILRQPVYIYSDATEAVLHNSPLQTFHFGHNRAMIQSGIKYIAVSKQFLSSVDFPTLATKICERLKP